MTMKTALITGGASGIGKACVIRMAQEGYGVVVADVNMSAAEALAEELTAKGLAAIAVHMDVSSEEEVESGFDKMMETYGSCDLVMSNAGIQIVHPFDEYPFSDWKKMMAIHADGAFLVARAAFRRMKASGKGGRIVFDLELIGDAVHTVFVQIADSRHFDIFQCGKACHRGARAGAGNTNFDHVIFSFSGVSNQNAIAVVDFMLYCLSRSPAVCFLACFHLHRLKPNADGLIPLAGARPACQ